MSKKIKFNTLEEFWVWRSRHLFEYDIDIQSCPIVSLNPCIDDKESAFNLIDNVYRDEFYPDGYVEGGGYRNSKIYEITVSSSLQTPEYYISIGYIFINRKYYRIECFLDVALQPEYVGMGLFKFVIPEIRRVASGLGYEELYSWTSNEKVKNSLVAAGFDYLDNDENKMLCCLMNKCVYLYDNI